MCRNWLDEGSPRREAFSPIWWIAHRLPQPLRAGSDFQTFLARPHADWPVDQSSAIMKTETVHR